MLTSRTVCGAAAVLLLVSLGSASRDEHFYEQRDVTFDLDQAPHPPEPDMQREVDLSELFNPMDFQDEQVIVHPLKQKESGVFTPRVLIPRGRPPSFRPRFFPPPLGYPVQFPLARPTPDNLEAICLHGDHRPRYPDSYFPRSGFGSDRRRAEAVNTAEAWLSVCCQGLATMGGDVTLCCATQAWELSVASFCKADSSVKDRLYHCCRKRGGERLDCFHGDSPNPNYEATEELPVAPLPPTANFHFNPDTCQRAVVTPDFVRGFKGKKKPLTPQKVNIRFPPGRPTATSIGSLCRDQKLRPLYATKCLPDVGYDWLARQAKAVNRMEKGFKKCCKKKKDVLACAELKWREELDRFCSHTGGDQTGARCCSSHGEEDRFSCFESSSADPHYNSTSAPDEVSLNTICDTHKIIKKKFPVGFPIKNLVDKCCPLSSQAQTACFVQRLDEMSANLCTSKKAAATPAVRRCCRTTPQDPQQCVSKILTDAATKATNVLRKKKKRCPIS